MKQPELGKKIAELRQAKGLTQGELAEKCRLSTRTIQRIESADVMPRSYTVKLIFSSLEYDIYDSFGRLTYRPDRAVYRMQVWSGQLMEYLIDLFNLKTNTMKKLLILSVPFLTFCTVLVFSFNMNTRAQSRTMMHVQFEEAMSDAKFMKWFNAGQFDSLGILFLDHACLMPDQHETITGRTNIVDYYRQLHLQGLRMLNSRIESMVVSDSIAVNRETWVVGIGLIPLASGTSLTQWHYVAGKWQIENDMTKSDPEFNPEAFQ